MKIKKLIDENGKLLGKFDIFLPLFIAILLAVSVFVFLFISQKDEYITVDLFTSGGEWWWNNPSPPYWLVDPVKVGDVEYDSSGKKVVDVLEVKKFSIGERKMLWIKAKIKVKYSEKSEKYLFRREPLEIGSVVNISPGNINLTSNVISIEGFDDDRENISKVIKIKIYNVYPWFSDQIKNGDSMVDLNGKVIAEVLDKKVSNAEMITADDLGRVHATRNPLKRDITLDLEVQVTKIGKEIYFHDFQPIKIGFEILVPFDELDIKANIIDIAD